MTIDAVTAAHKAGRAAAEHVDVLIIGAGISGIGAGCHLTMNCPSKSFVILEGRDAIGGTWDLFRYPGIRSDSDMYTLGYSFRPWTDPKAIADAPAILKYVTDTAADYGVDEHIRFNHKVISADWSTRDAHWVVRAVQGTRKDPVTFTADFLFLCGGYYSYDEAYTPDYPGRDAFRGTFIHPQFWPEDLDYRGKKVVVIGSGATAVTLVPEMAKHAAHVTMLQRSPTYVVSRPSQDAIANWLRAKLPSRLAYGLTRWKNVLLGMYFYRKCVTAPKQVKAYLLGLVQSEIGEEMTAQHFTPTYKPWDQRVCLVPDSDLFKALKSGAASVVTGRIDTFTPTGIRLETGEELEADIIVSATGLKLQVWNGLDISVDGKLIQPSATMAYKGFMYSGVPNLASSFGYTNASWTLKCDLTCAYVCRLLNYMDRHGYDQAVPHVNDPDIREEPWLTLTSGYIQRALDQFPKQGSKLPWKLHQNYAKDLIMLRFGKLDDGSLVFSRKPEADARPAPRAIAAE